MPPLSPHHDLGLAELRIRKSPTLSAVTVWGIDPPNSLIRGGSVGFSPWECGTLSTMERGFVQVYTGNGKGKTTAAFGLALRAAGHDLRTYIGQFMKGRMYGEVQALRDHPLIEIEQYGDALCLRREEVTAEHAARARRGMERAREKMCSGDFDMVILDEVNVTIWFGMLAVDEVLALLEQRPPGVEVILTGRYAPEEILAKADLVTEMREGKHYFAQGVQARDGIER